MQMLALLASLVCTLGTTAGEGETSFTDEASILSISREDQTEALKTRLLKEEVTLPQVIDVLTTYRKVTRDQYLLSAHLIGGARGTVTLKGGVTYLWEFEPNYAATVKGHRREIVYLLHPRLKVEPAPNGGQP